jgi:hypothetical protein
MVLSQLVYHRLARNNLNINITQIKETLGLHFQRDPRVVSYHATGSQLLHHGL